MAPPRNIRGGRSGTSALPRRHKPDYRLILYTGILMMLGLIIIYSIGPQRANVLNNAYGTDYSASYFVVKQAISLVIALGSFAVAMALPINWLKRYAGWFMGGAVALCLLLTVAGAAGLGLAQCALGACRWYNLGPLGTLQPAEFLKFAIVIFLAGFLALRIREGVINDLHKTIIPFAAIAVLVAVLIIGFQRDMGTGLAIFAIMGTMLMTAGVNWRNGLMLVVAGLLLGGILILAAPHRIERVVTFLQGDTATGINADDSGYHIRHAKIAIGSGGLLGVGIGNSVQATGYLPEAINDSVFAIMGETFGFIGLLVVLLLFMALLLVIANIAARLSDPWMRLATAGVFGWLAAHVVMNIASMIGLAPVTGITLPLLSFGGTSMVFIAAALGLVFHFSRYTEHDLKELPDENFSRRRRVGRTRYAGRRGH